MEIELVIFDLAGTTVKDNKDVARVLQNALQKYNVHVSVQDAAAVMGVPKPVAIRMLLEKYGHHQAADKFVDEIHTSFVNEMVFFYKNDKSVGEKEGVTEAFQKLKANNIKIAIDTDFDRFIADPLIKRMGWEENKLIDAVVTSDEVPRGRPYPDMIFKAMQLTGVTDVKMVIKVGDTAADMQEGTSAGCTLVVGVTSGAYTREQLLKEPHTHLIDQIPELLKMLKIG